MASINAMPESVLLPLYLWDLRAQMEAQLRCLTDIQQTYDKMLTSASKEDARRKVIKDLKDVLTMNAAINAVCSQALSEAGNLPESADRL